MGIWKTIGRSAGRFRNLVRPSADAGLVSIEGIESASALVRAIDASMPRGATLWIDFPGDEAVELFLTERTRRQPEASGKSFRLTIRGDNLPMLARLVEGAPPGALGLHLGVDHNRLRLLAAFDLDIGPVEVGVSPRVAPDALRIFRNLATGKVH